MGVKYPFGSADNQIKAAASSVEVTISNQKTLVDFGTLDADTEIDLVIGGEAEAGARLTIKGKSDGTARDITCGEGLTGPGLTGVISKTKVAEFEYDGSSFIQLSVLQLD